jgi:CBS domain-containing protein
MEGRVSEENLDVQVLAEALDAARDAAGLGRLFVDIRRLVARFALSGLDALEVGRLASLLYDKLLVRAAGLARDGPQEVPDGCALAVLGSQGRREQFLATDQDNALILADEAGDDRGFEAFALRLAAILEETGVPPCPKGIMAASPAWRKRLAAWHEDIDAAAARPDAAAVLLVSLLADLRPVAGDAGLVAAVTGHLHACVADTPLLTRGLAREALRFAPPTFFFGHLHKGFFGLGHEVVDMKRTAVFPLVQGIKSLALDAGITAVDTVSRLAALAGKGLVGAKLADRLTAAWSCVQSLRLTAQARACGEGRAMDNGVDLAGLDTLARKRLEAAFRVVAELQDILEHHFGLRYLT